MLMDMRVAYCSRPRETDRETDRETETDRDREIYTERVNMTLEGKDD